MVVSISARISLVKLYYSNGEILAQTLREYRRVHRIKRNTGPCSKPALQNLIEKFERTGSVLDAPREGRPDISTGLSSEIARTVEELSGKAPHGECSAREVSRIVDVPTTSVLRIMKNLLNLHPYKIKRVQELKDRDLPTRLKFAERCLELMDADPTWLQRILWTDEAHFYLHGGVNTHNSVIWTEENPHHIVQKPLYDQHVTAWCGFTADFIIGPYFFEHPTQGGHSTVTVNSSRYATLISNFVIPALSDRGRLQDVIFQQDGAPPHTQKNVASLLRSVFRENLIGLGFGVEWPPRSPDLSPPDFWLWGYLKFRVYRSSPRNLSELKSSIQAEVLNIERDQLRSAVSSFATRVVAILGAEGGHIEAN